MIAGYASLLSLWFVKVEEETKESGTCVMGGSYAEGWWWGVGGN